MQVPAYLLSFFALTQWATNSLADTSIYYLGGEKLSQGQNPYDGSSPFFSAPLGARFIFLLGKSLQIVNYPVIWNVVNIVGVSCFFFVILSELKLKHHILLWISLLLLTAPVREMVVNNQITGLVLGFAALSILLSRSTQAPIIHFLLLIPIYLAFELKPNLIFGLLLYYFWINRKSVRNYTSILIAGPFVITFMILQNEYINWLTNITSQGARSITGFESLGISTLAYESNILSFEFARALGLALFAITFLLYSRLFLKKDGELIFSMIPLFALTFPYLHLLDLIVALPFVLPMVIRRKSVLSLAPIVFAVVFLPRPSESLFKNLAIVALILVIAFVQYQNNMNRIEFILSLSSGITLIVSNYYLMLADLSDHAIQNYTVLRTWFIILIVMYGINSERITSIFQSGHANHNTEVDQGK